MRTQIKILTLFLLLIIGVFIAPRSSSAQNVSVSFQVFYDELSPYGTWVVSPDYGYVWLPDAGPGFSPYSTNGYWVFTDDGWMWVSEYSWGWAPFHYGRWYTDPYYGPMWVPDYDWGPGWVTWRRSGDYYGWAPIGPGVNINVAYSNGYYVPNDRWTYVRDRDFGRRDINNYYIDNSTNITIINNSTVINNTRVDRTDNVTYNTGPDRAEVEKHVGKTIAPVAVKASRAPGQHVTNNEVEIYRPKVEKTASASHKPAPSKVADLKDVKPQQQKGNQPAKEQPVQQQKHNTDQPAKEQPVQQQKHNTDQPAKEQPVQQQKHNTDQPAKEQPAQQQHQNQPDKQQPPQQQQPNQPAKQNTPESQKAAPAEKKTTSKQQKQPKQQKPAKQQKQQKPPKNTGEKAPPK
jgi:DNA segregation ATPase FtsK/SpoIIIE-like protein